MLSRSQCGQPRRADAGRRILWTAALAAACSSGSTVCAADPLDFRVLTTVSLEASGQPVSSNLTIFHGQRIYDFPLDDSGQATVFEMAQERFTLLDSRQRMQCRLSGKELVELIAAIGQRGRHAKQGAAGTPGFRERFDAEAQRVELMAVDGGLSYVAVGRRADHPGVVQAYGRFADWFARLNATRDGRLPEARLRLNRSLYSRNLIPVSVLRREPGQPSYCSHHEFQWSLDLQDLERVGTAQQWSAELAHVSLVQFRRRQADAPSRQASR